MSDSLRDEKELQNSNTGKMKQLHDWEISRIKNDNIIYNDEQSDIFCLFSCL